MVKKGLASILALFIWFFLFTPKALAASCDYTVDDVAGLLNAKNTIRDTNNNMSKDIVVCLEGGNYYLDNTISFDPQDSGTNGYKIIYKNYQNEEPILIGGQPITNWQQHTGSIYKAHVGSWKFYNLMENNQLAVMAREPNEGYLKTETDGGDPAKFAYVAGDLPSRFNYSDAQVFVKVSPDDWEWFSETLPITNINWNSRLITVDKWANWWPIEKGDNYFVQGALEFLDQPGEFYLNESTEQLYYWPRGGLPQNQEIVAPKMKRVIEVVGGHDIRFEGLIFTLSDFTKDHGIYYAVENGTDHALIYMEDATRITVKNCTIQNVGFNAVLLRGYAQGNTIDGNLIKHVGNNGIRLDGLGVGPEHSYINKSNIVSNNRIWDIGIRRGGQTAVISLYQSGNNQITHNEVRGAPYNGIMLLGKNYIAMKNAPWGDQVTWENHWDFLYTRNNYIAFNDVAETMQDMNDGGGFYSFGTGKGNILDNNRIHDITTSSPKGNAMGMYFDNSSDYYTVKNNIIYGVTERDSYAIQTRGSYNVFENNIIVDNTCGGRVGGRWGGVEMRVIRESEQGLVSGHHVIRKNILYRQNGYHAFYFPIWGTAGASNNIDASDYNLFHVPDGAYHMYLRGAGDISLSQWQTYGFDTHSIEADPKFVDRANHDYRLKTDSPALALGFKQIDQSKIGLCGPPWNSKQGCYQSEDPTPTPTPTLVVPPCPNGLSGNLDCDSQGLVDGVDLSILLANWHPNPLAPTPKPNHHSADLNSDNKVDGTDLSILLSNWQVE